MIFIKKKIDTFFNKWQNKINIKNFNFIIYIYNIYFQIKKIFFKKKFIKIIFYN